MKKQYLIVQIIFSIFLLSLTLTLSNAAIIQVPRDFAKIQDAINAAKSGDTVKVASGLYIENIIWPEIADIKLIGNQEDTIIDGNNISHAISFNMKSSSIINSRTIISGFKIQNGKAPESLPYGGAIYLKNASPDINNIIVFVSKADRGGAIYCENSTINLSSSIITRNIAINGGGIYINNSKVNFSNVILVKNTAAQGSGLSFFNSIAHILNSKIIENLPKTETLFSSSVFVYNSSLNIQKTILWNEKTNHEIYFSKFSNNNKSIIQDSNVRKGRKTIPLNENVKLNWQKSNISKKPEPFSLKKDKIPPVISGIDDDPIPKSSKTWQWYAKDKDSNIQFRYIVDQQSNSVPKGSYTQTNTITIAPPEFSDGTWYLHVQAIDTALNESSITTVSVILDSTIPVMSGLENVLTPVKEINWSWKALDKASGIKFRYLIDQKLNSKPSGEFTEKNSVTFNGPDGPWYIHVQAKDSAGNLSDIVTVSAIIDNTPPVIRGLTDDNLPQKTKTWTWNAEDQDNHITYRYKINQIPDTKLAGIFVSTNEASISNSDGKWYLHVQASDRAGNISKTVTIYALLDNTPPKIEGLTDDSKPGKNKKWVWKIIDQDEQTKCRYIINQEAVSIPSGEFNVVNNAQINEKQGIWYLHVQAIDRAGNLSKIVSVSCTLDNKSPVIIGLKDHLTPLKEIQWNWQVLDTDSNIVFRHIINQSPNYIFSANDNFKNINSAKISKQEGTWYLHVQAKDSSQNLSEKITVSAILDNTPPVITGISTDKERKKEKKWSWDSIDKDKLIMFRYLVDELSDSTPQGQFTNTKSHYINNLNGKYYIHVQAKDRAGNLSKTIHASVLMDNKPPVIEGIYNDPIPCQSKIWNWTAQDKDQSILFRFLVNKEEHSVIGGQFSALTKTSISQKDGLYYLHVQAKDSAGNLSKIVKVSTLLDNTPPTIKGLTYDNIPKKSVQWNWQVIDIDKNTLCRFQINQKDSADSFNDFSNINQLNLSDRNGKWYLHVQAKDSAGNLSEITTASVLLDCTPPVIMGLSDDPLIHKNKEWQWYAEDSDTFILYRHLIDKTNVSKIHSNFKDISTASISDSNGLWYLNVQAKDRAGNISKIVSVSTFLDNVPPIIKGLTNDHFPKKDKTWSWYAIDKDPKILFRYKIDKEVNNVPSGQFNTKTKASIKDLDGKWFIHVQARDSAGNTSEVITVSVVLDNTPPEILGIADDFLPKKMKKWDWHTIDQDSQISYRFNVDSKPNTSINTSYTETSTVTISGLDGIWYLNLQAKDRAGNKSDIVTVKTTIDNTPPVITGLYNDPSPQKMKIWQWNSIDSDTQITYRYLIDEHSQSNLSGSFTHISNAKIDNANGKWYLHVQAKDRAGNLSNISTVSVQLDCVAPLITGLSSDTKPTKSKKWVWSAKDNDTNVVFRYLVSKVDSLKLKNSYKNETHAKIENEDGKWFIHVQAKDSAGNESDIISVYTILDNTPPVIQGITSEQTPVKQKTWTWKVADKDSQIKYRHLLNQKPIPDFSNSFTNTNSVNISNKNGKWYLHVQAMDRAGNFSDPLTVFAYFDNKPPIIKGLLDDNNPVKEKLWHWETKDNDNVILYRHEINQIADSKPYGPFNHINTAEQKNCNGLWYIHVQAKDRAGNLSEIVSVAANLDNTPPIINELENDDLPKISKKWKWIIEDNDPEVLSRYTIDQNSYFIPSGIFQQKTTAEISGLEGKFYLHVQARDRANNVSKVVSVYTILDQTPPVITGLSNDQVPGKKKNWKWNAFDNDTNILYRYTIDKNSKSQPSGSFMNIQNAELKNNDGKWFIHVQAKDRAGHLSEINSVYAIIDTKAPVIKGLSDDHIPSNSKTWSWYADDSDSNILYRHVVSKNKDAPLKGTYTRKTKQTLDLPDGKYFLRVQAKDTAKNISEIVTVSAIIDKTPPIIKGLSSNDKPVKSTKWEWEAQDSDKEIKFRYIIDQNPHSSVSGIFRKHRSASIDNENGLWYLHVQAIDRAGNLSEIIDVHTLLDNIPPKIIGLYDDIIPRNKKIWKWGFFDKDPNVLFRYVINKSEKHNLNTPFITKQESEVIQKNGKWYLHIQAKDSAGNLGETQTVYTIIDKETKGLHVNLHIHFDSNKDYTEILFIDAIKRIAKILNKYPDSMAVIEAHCDNTGEEESNQNLSERRAKNVRSILIKKYKISSSRLKAVGFGSTKPIADNSTEEGRRLNRRANAYIYHTD